MQGLAPRDTYLWRESIQVINMQLENRMQSLARDRTHEHMARQMHLIKPAKMSCGFYIRQPVEEDKNTKI